jgi:hypothetical protein
LADNTLTEEKMANRNNRWISKRSDGKWANKKEGAERASSVHDTQREAEEAGRTQLSNSGGGELITKGKDGRIRSKDTIAPAKDPHPPKDTEH